MGIGRQFHESTCVKNASPTMGNMAMRILLLGSPGSGKGTQSARLQKNFNIAAISSGDLLRRNIANGTEIGKFAAKEIERGAYVPDNIMIELITNELRIIKRKNWLLDGFPRTINQATALDENLVLTGQPLNLTHGIDDITGEKLSKRSDDNAEVFKIRLQKHRELTEPLLEYYSKRNILVTFVGSTSDEIYPQIESELLRRFGVENFNQARPHIVSEEANNILFE
ncbi:3855_t:CDS:2 [Acaulospora colombiana]|uniref:3855_t:CDS:1 n=1 Tax=Acaulospora colombiana TaxID=27376 RepID=A0ACA9LET5_9GLOM|nr:3855_t:CDS:2 [Acaulospora colombiana]